MTVLAVKAIGTIIKYTDEGAETIGGVTKINGVELQAESVDATVLSVTDNPNGAEQSIQGIRKMSDCVIEGFYSAGESGQAAIYTHYLRNTTGGNRAMQILAPNGAHVDFTAHVTNLKQLGEADPKGLIPFSATFHITDIATFTDAA